MAIVYQLKIKHDQDKFGGLFLDAKRPVNFPHEDKHVVNERKSHEATQKKCLHVVHFNVPRDWFETNSGHQKRYSEDGEKIRGCRALLGRVISHLKSTYNL